MIPIQHRMHVATAPIRLALKQAGCEMRVAIPGIIVANPEGDAFNPTKLTVSVQPAIREVMRVAAIPTPIALPILDDVPFSIPRSGGFALTLPIKIDDECLVVFSDMAFDHWWQSGGLQNQPEGKLYRHDIGDGIAILGVASNPSALKLVDYSTNSAQLRSDDGTIIVDISTSGVKVFGSGTAMPVVTDAFYQWFLADALPFLISKGYTGAAPPAGSITSIFEAE
jgi:hypothetical protein